MPISDEQWCCQVLRRKDGVSVVDTTALTTQAGTRNSDLIECSTNDTAMSGSMARRRNIQSQIGNNQLSTRLQQHVWPIVYSLNRHKTSALRLAQSPDGCGATMFDHVIVS
jgi:hypothetical protein